MKTFAIALYENEAESEDELNFNKNDLLQIIQFDYLGMDGWWLCKLLKTNAIGLAAGNRLKIVNDEKILQKINILINSTNGANLNGSLNSNGGNNNNNNINTTTTTATTPSKTMNTNPSANRILNFENSNCNSSNNKTNKSNSIISTSSSSSSIISSSSASLSSSSLTMSSPTPNNDAHQQNHNTKSTTNSQTIVSQNAFGNISNLPRLNENLNRSINQSDVKTNSPNKNRLPVLQTVNNSNSNNGNNSNGNSTGSTNSLSTPNQINSRSQALSLQPQPNKIVLPAKSTSTTNGHSTVTPSLNGKLTLNNKNHLSVSKSSFLTESTENILNLRTNLKKFDSKQSADSTSNKTNSENNLNSNEQEIGEGGGGGREEETEDKRNTNLTNEEVDEQEEEEDDYDYDIPENNKPAPKFIRKLTQNMESKSHLLPSDVLTKNLKQKSSDLETVNDSCCSSSSQTVRKSTSPTIDSGISSSSLVSLNSDLMNMKLSSDDTGSSSSSTLSSKLNLSSNKRNSNDDSLSTTSSNESFSVNTLSYSSTNQNDSIKKSSNLLQIEFWNRTEKLSQICSIISNEFHKEKELLRNESTPISQRKENLNSIKENLFELKKHLHEYLINTLKRVKQEHACFHVNLNVFNKFKTIYRHKKDFYFYFETTMNKLSKIYNWNPDLILVASNEESTMANQQPGTTTTSGSCSISLQNKLNSFNEFYELMSKINYLNELIDSLKELIAQSNLFEYHSETSSTNFIQTNNNSFSSSTSTSNHLIQKSDQTSGTKNDENSNEDYEYEYDNNSTNIGVGNGGSGSGNGGGSAGDGTRNYQLNNTNNYDDDDDYEKIYESDYWQINDEQDKQETQHEEINSRSSPSRTADPSLCLTLKKNEEKIKREIRIATSSSSNETNRINMVDQMLLKFYLKHIEDNQIELNSIYELLIESLDNSRNDKSSSSENMDEELDENELDNLAHKLAINGHKLVFICDTLQRNINNTHLKSALYESSNTLCDALKLYMIRIKTNNLSQLKQHLSSSSANDTNNTNIIKQRQLAIDSLNSVLNASNQFKQVIIKYYLKSY